MTAEKPETKKIIQASVDQLDAELAVLTSDELAGPIYLPVSCLPTDVQEGDVLSISISLQQAVTQKRKSEVTQLIEKLAAAKAKRRLGQK